MYASINTGIHSPKFCQNINKKPLLRKLNRKRGECLDISLPGKRYQHVDRFDISGHVVARAVYPLKEP